MPGGELILAHDRREAILKQLAEDKSVLVRELSQKLNVTPETIRKDLTILEGEGKLIKTHGGAFTREGVKNDLDIRIRETIYLEAKEKIGKKCSDLINDGDTVILDASTTSLQIAKNIINKSKVTVLTNSLKVADELSNYSNIKLVLLGGLLDHSSLSFVGNDAEKMLEKYFVDKAFVSCRGISMENGITDSNEFQAIIRRLMFKKGQKTYLIIDKTKFDVIAFSLIGDFSITDAVVAEEFLNEQWVDFFKANNIEMIKADD
ncbi:DeoR/GlpR family DNA-binding transcription regulator [Proteiniborus sp. MB09-C3]|uniref:DeoR/GlpR family DNA-binding transcription regulator n=1 Tax=Proteiniborus sp. MB09-C3 TaxID=3050072 RepID=UPI0025572C3B|nr:DeoR/GlpR family DNA-binding transcription regulator [Proteiniborus sp. MB09-C3]WIV13436.1 DeoR/GlpR family DNA-binding transcription regulator [Proteiniborus sp. MB09-C3]